MNLCNQRLQQMSYTITSFLLPINAPAGLAAWQLPACSAPLYAHHGSDALHAMRWTGPGFR